MKLPLCIKTAIFPIENTLLNNLLFFLFFLFITLGTDSLKYDVVPLDQKTVRIADFLHYVLLICHINIIYSVTAAAF